MTRWTRLCLNIAYVEPFLPTFTCSLRLKRRTFSTWPQPHASTVPGMSRPQPGPELKKPLAEMLGYLNFSSGNPDPRFQSHLNELCAWAQRHSEHFGAPWLGAGVLLQEELERLTGATPAFEDVEQATTAIGLTIQEVLPAYRQFHRDLLFHQTDANLFRPFFLARAFEAVLAEGGPWDETERIVAGAIDRLNDFLGHRPVAVLHNNRKTEPYAHEWVRPLPIYLREAGPELGPYKELVEQTLAILRGTDQGLLRATYFDLNRMDELALDPRAYDFDHPVNRRINYQFGQWDPHCIDNQGFFRRFVVTSVTFEALWDRVQNNRELPQEEVVFEAAAVLAGVIVMASAVSGYGPDAHDSDTTLATMLPSIAAARDQFYEQLIERVPGKHGARLKEEAKSRRQPFAAARQALNQRLARQRASQLQHVSLARLFAQMGFPDASRRQISVVPVASARIHCEIHCRITGANLAIDHGDLSAAARAVREIEDLLTRGIECGAIVDPWNMLGFSGQFSLFPAIENSVPDHRIDELLDMVDATFTLYARLQSEAAAVGQDDLQRSVAAAMDRLATWWDKFASREVSGIEGFSGREAAESAESVANAIRAWRLGGGAAGDVAFWREHVESFNSPRAYGLVVEALLKKDDYQSSMALMMQWLSQVDDAPLEAGEYSFHRLALEWLEAVQSCPEFGAEERGKRIKRFFDFLEANAGEYWSVPHFTWPEKSGSPARLAGADGEEADEEDGRDLFAAAYEDFTYEDTTDDGVEGSLIEGGPAPTDYEMEHEGAELTRRLKFLAALAEMWKAVAMQAAREGQVQGGTGGSPAHGKTTADDPPVAVASQAGSGIYEQSLDAWCSQSVRVGRELRRLLSEIHSHQIPAPRANHDSLVEFDRRQIMKEMLLDNVIRASVSAATAARCLLAVTTERPPQLEKSDDDRPPRWEYAVIPVLRAAAWRDAAEVRRRLPAMLDALRELPLLYVPLSRGGEPTAIVQARNLRRLLAELMREFPRLGLLAETCELMKLSREMESEHPVGRGAVSEFDQLFVIGYQAMVEALIHSALRWPRGQQDERQEMLVEALNDLTEKVLQVWLKHSASLRLSVMEKPVLSGRQWNELVKFIKEYGGDLFTPRFLNDGNLRALLHQGAAEYLRQLQQEPHDFGELKLLDDLEHVIPAETAGTHLECVAQALLENIEEFNDYNHTTTQSDRGEMLYMFLDFLRIKAEYERMAWNLRPVVWAHEVLVRHGCDDAAEVWRRNMARETRATADAHLDHYRKLVEKYGMRLPTLADRLSERFVQPLEVDRLRALIEPAMLELSEQQPTRTFERLEQEINEFAQTPIGVGLDVPEWLECLEHEVLHCQGRNEAELFEDAGASSDWAQLSPEDVREQLESWKAE